jgi:hypothetical protein
MGTVGFLNRVGQNQQTSKGQDFFLQRNFETDERTALSIFNDPFSTPYSPVSALLSRLHAPKNSIMAKSSIFSPQKVGGGSCILPKKRNNDTSVNKIND